MQELLHRTHRLLTLAAALSCILSLDECRSHNKSLRSASAELRGWPPSLIHGLQGGLNAYSSLSYQAFHHPRIAQIPSSAFNKVGNKPLQPPWAFVMALGGGLNFFLPALAFWDFQRVTSYGETKDLKVKLEDVHQDPSMNGVDFNADADWKTSKCPSKSF